jgi:hypothetical protein
MKALRTAALAVFAVFILIGGLMNAPSELFGVELQGPPAEHNLSIMKVQNQWKVVLAQDTTVTTVRAKKGDKIIWTAKGSDVYFQFMDDKIFGKFTKVLKDGETLMLPVAATAKTGPNPYAVFCIADLEFATGDSPPVIIVE